MKLFVDTGSIKEIETIAALGILDGVTTNPSLLAKEPGDFRQSLKKICDIATNGMALIGEIMEIYNNYEFPTEVLVASCRHPIHVVEAARLGADIATCPASVIDALFNHPLTAIGLEKFLKDWEKVQAVKA